MSEDIVSTIINNIKENHTDPNTRKICYTYIKQLSSKLESLSKKLN
jgi:hypothetical protein